MILIALTLISSLAFLAYGLLCVFSNHMKEEFSRFGMPQFRILTGILEILGGLGLFMGFWYLPLNLLASAGLATLMAMGLVVRIRCRDRFIEMIPALILMIMNAWIFTQSLSLK
jgi:uncharacterized membrane protein YphA (DoxX/SURF4 family)